MRQAAGHFHSRRSALGARRSRVRDEGASKPAAHTHTLALSQLRLLAIKARLEWAATRAEPAQVSDGWMHSRRHFQLSTRDPSFLQRPLARFRSRGALGRARDLSPSQGYWSGGGGELAAPKARAPARGSRLLLTLQSACCVLQPRRRQLSWRPLESRVSVSASACKLDVASCDFGSGAFRLAACGLHLCFSRSLAPLDSRPASNLTLRLALSCVGARAFVACFVRFVRSPGDALNKSKRQLVRSRVHLFACSRSNDA